MASKKTVLSITCTWAGWTKEKILALPKGSRPQPVEYLKPEYIKDYLLKISGLKDIKHYTKTEKLKRLQKINFKS